MKSCPEIEPFVTAYLDGEVAGPERLAVESHLGACRPCRERAAAERSAREVVRARRARLLEHAPEALRAECASLAHAGRQALPAADAVRPRLRRQPWLSLSMAATLLLAVAGVFMYGQNTRLGAALAAQLTLDHVKCFAMADPEAIAVAPARLETSFENNYGWHVTIPSGADAEHLELLAARRCMYHEGQMAHLMYRRNGHPVSLFVLPNQRQARRIVKMMGHEAVIWTKDGRTYALVGREPPAQMEELAAYVQGHTD